MAAKLSEEMILSPKELQQRSLRAHKLQKIDCQIQTILNMNRQQHNQYKDFSDKISAIQNFYMKQNKQLKAIIQQLTSKCYQLQNNIKLTKQQEAKHQNTLNQLTQEKIMRLKQIQKLKDMIRNQQSLLDQYKKNLQDEINLEKEVMKSDFDQKKSKMQKQFNHALLQMQRKFEEKLIKALQQLKLKEYKAQFHDLKKYINSNKQNSQKTMKKSNSYAKKPVLSLYSTNDKDEILLHRQPKHNQPIFIS